MSLTVRNTKELIDPDKFRWKILCYGLPGEGKTTWLSDAPNIGIAACEDGHGKGLLSVATANLDFVEPSSYADFEAICSNRVFPNKDTVALDSLSSMCKGFIKDYAISIPRAGAMSEKRARGIPELDDYGIMGETTRRLLAKLLALDKHIIVTATLKIEKPDMTTGQGSFLMGPDLPGAMFLGSTAMFDTVMFLRHRPIMRDPKDAKTKYTQRYFVTSPDGSGAIVKCRSVEKGSPITILDQEEIYDPVTGQGTFPVLLAKIKKRYTEVFERAKRDEKATVMVAVA